MAARQSVRVDFFHRHFALADLCARQGAHQRRAVGILECDLDCPGRSNRRLPGNPRARCLLGRHSREISLHSVRHLSVRPAMASGVGNIDVHRVVLSVEPPQHVGSKACAGVGRRTGPDRRPDVGRNLRAVFCFTGSLGRPPGDSDPRDVRARVRFSARNCGRPRPPFQTPRDPIALRALCRADPRRPADQPAVHGERDVSAVLA